MRKPLDIFRNGFAQAPRGERHHYVHVNAMMPPSLVAQLKTVGAELQALGYADTDLSSLMRQSVNHFVAQLEKELHQ